MGGVWWGMGFPYHIGEERQEGLWNRRCGRSMGEEMERCLSEWDMWKRPCEKHEILSDAERQGMK